MLKILADENIPYAREAFSGFGTVTLSPGREISNSILKDNDFLIIRSVTKVNEELLKNTRVKFVGTTTIGLDHIDTEYLKKNKIGFVNSPGCNADSVAEYIFAGLLKTASEMKTDLAKKTMGIIGYGNIGSRVAGIAKSFGLGTFINDPPLQRRKVHSFFVSYEEALKADIITFHVPLNMEGIDKTYHMLSQKQLNEFDTNKIIINSSRGSVISNKDLKEFLLKKKNTVIVDVWENEPGIDPELLEMVSLGSAHIAGYSLEGKINGTVMVYNALCKFLEIFPGWQPDLAEVDKSVMDYPESAGLEEGLNNMISKIYNIKNDDRKLRELAGLPQNEQGKYFDQLRKNYPVRREFSNYSVRINRRLEREIKILQALRFRVQTV